METSRTPADIFRDLLQKQVEQQRKLRPDAAIEDPFANPLTAKLLEALNASGSVAAAPPAPAPPESLSAFVASPAVLRAAMEDSFDLAAIGADERERAALLDASNVVVVCGQRRLRLDDTARAELLAAAQGTDLYRRQLDEAVEDDKNHHAEIARDPIRLPSAWLRCFLSGNFADITKAPLQELRAADAARERLQFVKQLPDHVPQLDDLSRRLELAELLEPLRLLIGFEGGWDGTPTQDRFVGRDEELTLLRGFVDELRSKSLLELSARFAKRLATKSTGLLMIYGRGGLGKSTLIAKFLLDHAFDRSRPFPFAYLDFDRAALDAERPRQLLAEIVRQVALQFPEVRPDLDKLAADIRASLAAPAATASSTSAEIQDPVARFVELMHDRITQRSHAFLLVLDTLEIVQWNPGAIASLASLIDDFRSKGLDELRVVASGRADIPELHPDRPRTPPPGDGGPSYVERLQQFLQDKRDIELRPLVVAEARTLCTSLGRATIGDDWNAAWSASIAGKDGDDSLRREPLSIRVAVDVVARADAPERPRLVADIEQAGTDASGDFVARLYEKRIVNHVRDPLARKLAWPGLVVRRITDEIARELLAPHCGITPDEAVQAVAALAQEVWMVTRSDDGSLRHRPELRSRTLPLMRKKDPAAFDAIARDAVEYFGQHRTRSSDDYVEWIYHRLLAGEAPEAMTSDAGPEMLRRFSDVVSDFPQPVASYITSRTATTRLSPERLQQLRPADALYHLSLTSPGTWSLDDLTIDADVLRVAGTIDARALSTRPEADDAACSLWIKTGLWTRMPIPMSAGDQRSGPFIRSYTYWAAHVAQAAGEKARAELLNSCLLLVTNRMREGQSGFRTTVQVMALARLAGSEAFKDLDKAVARIAASLRAESKPSIQAALRTAIVFGDTCRGPALNVWLASRRRGGDDRVRDTSMSRAELEALAAMDTDASETLTRALRQGKLEQRVTDDLVLKTAYHALDEVLSELSSGAPFGDPLSRMFALRSEDWIVPFAYAAARVTAGRSDASTDMVIAMRLADEAGDLPGFAERCAASGADPAAVHDLRFLIDCRKSWADAVTGLLAASGAQTPGAVPQDAPTASDAPPPPGPVVHTDDPQKDRWGGKPEVDGRRVSAVIDSVERDTFYFSVTVESTDGSSLEPPIVFHLHDSYARSVVRLKRVADKRSATLSEWDADGVFAIGVQVRNARGQWISLELDLADLPNLPKRFLSR